MGNETGSVRAALGVGAVVLVLIAGVVVVAALSFSVQVRGDSMRPTLREGDRLEVDVRGGDVRRFDLVEAIEPGHDGTGGTTLVKRVVGMPGDRVMVRGGEAPAVMVRPAGTERTFRVDNPAWAAQVGLATDSCCTPAGTSRRAGQGRAWATVPEDAYWLLGDNWGGSTDSRAFGFVSAEMVKTRLVFRILPLDRLGGLGAPARLVPAR